MIKFILLVIVICIVIFIVKRIKSNDHHDTGTFMEKIYHKINHSNEIEFKRKDDNK